jgi:hypothetical protein
MAVDNDSFLEILTHQNPQAKSYTNKQASFLIQLNLNISTPWIPVLPDF